ncbi:MAG: peptidoglycan D,D-transpeptidase FtsI family protein [Chloroflexota bacterium]
MSANVRRLATIFTVLFVFLAAYLSYWQVVEADFLRKQMPYNAPRLVTAQQRVQRGAILDRNGKRLVWSEKTADGWQRRYAYAPLVHVTGYLSYQYGTANIENEFNEYLSGDRGINPVDLFRKEFLYQPVVGADIVTTIDLDLQRVADQALGDWPGAIVALNPRTGEILAFASHPYFDPNQLSQDWSRLSNDPGRPFVNRAANGQYVPGSTFKAVTLSTALQDGVVNPKTTFTNKGDLVVEGFHIKYTNPPGKATFDLRDAYAFSVNAVFAETGLNLGANRLVEGAKRFGFEQAPPLAGIPTSASHVFSTPGFLDAKPALASTAFGQGELAVTPLQMALVVAASANGGVVPTPYVVAEARDPAGHVTFQARPKAWTRAMSEETAKTVNDMMIYSVQAGLANGASIPGVQVAGKTGTAEPGANVQSHAWFIGYAPADNPTIAIAVIRENAGQGGAEAVPQARQVMQAWLSRR